ncbi:hypothetical protein [Polymorphospora rubra]
MQERLLAAERERSNVNAAVVLLASQGTVPIERRAAALAAEQGALRG